MMRGITDSRQLKRRYFREQETEPVSSGCRH